MENYKEMETIAEEIFRYMYNVGQPRISEIIKNKTWKHLK